MYRRILIGGVTAAAIVGAGGTALAVSGSDIVPGSPNGTPASTTSPAAPGAHPGSRQRQGRGHRLLRRLAHAQVVTRGKGGFVTHDLIRGTVTAVSPTSITVQAPDKKSETFSVGSATKVRVRTIGHGVTASSISDVHTGDHVLVAGTGTSKFAAKHIVDVRK